MSDEQKNLPFDDPAFIEMLEQGFGQNVSEDPVNKMFDLARGIKDYLQTHPDFVKNQPALSSRYQNLLIKASWVAFPLLEKRERIELLHTSLGVTGRLPNFDLINKFRVYISGVLLLEDRDKEKYALRQAMLENSEKFIPISTVTVEDKIIPQTIGSWLKHYNVHVNGNIGSSLERAQYFTQPPALVLSEEQKKQLRSFIEAFDYLKLSSINLESDTEVLSVDVVGEPMVFVGGKIEPIIANTQINKTMQELDKLGIFKDEMKDELLEKQIQKGALHKSVFPQNARPTPPSISKPVAKIAQSAPAPRSIASPPPPSSPSSPPPVAKPTPLPTLSRTPTPPPPPQPITKSVVEKKVIAKSPKPPEPVEKPIVKSKEPTGPDSPSLIDSSAVLAEQQKVVANLSPERLRDVLFNALNQQSQLAALAALRSLAQSGDLLNIIKADSRFYYLLSNQYRQDRELNKLKEFNLLFARAQYVGEVMRYILEKRLKISEDKAAHIGVSLVNLLKQRGVDTNHWSYWDEANRSYKWL